MPAAWRRPRSTADIWPGWVDALSTLLIIIIFIQKRPQGLFALKGRFVES